MIPQVLHIEDDPGVASSMALLLRLEGYGVVSAATRNQALDQITLNGLEPDLILCDYPVYRRMGCWEIGSWRS